MNRKSMFKQLALGLGLTVALLWLSSQSETGLLVARAASYTVCPAGPPTCDYSVIQSAVDAAGDGDVIKVATGTYTDINNRFGHAQMVYLNKSVTIRGGYTTTNWITSDPDANPTTLDAQGGGRVLYITGSISPTIEGLRITGGDADGLGSPIGIDAGGGILIITATATIKNNQIFSNAANSSHNGDGGGVYLYQSDATLDGNTISNNTAQREGAGGKLFESTATLTGNTINANSPQGINLENSPSLLTHNTISENGNKGVFMSHSAAKLVNNTINSNPGGGVFLWESDEALVTGNTISYNNNNSNGAGLWSNGDNVTISGNTISNNSADWFSGISVGGLNVRIIGNIISSNTAVNGGAGGSIGGDVEFIGNTVINNTAGGSGGGLYISGVTGVQIITGNIFSGNSASEGGAILLGGGNPTLTNNIIVDNHADNNGSAIHINDGVPSSSLLHNTIARNSGGDGSGIYIYGSTITLTNNIIADHTVGIYVHFDASASLESTLWGNGVWANGLDWDGAGTISTTNNLWGNPDFVDPDAGDYHIGPNSDAIDQGVDAGVTNDIDFHPRPYQAPDIGADEYWPPGALKFIYLPLIMR